MKKRRDEAITYLLIGMVVVVLGFALTQGFAIAELQQAAAQGSANVAQAAPTMVGGC